MRIVAILMMLALTACGAPSVAGNAQGGAMPWAFTNTASAFNAAQAHCQKFGKDARITQIAPYAGGSVAFDCVKG